MLHRGQLPHCHSFVYSLVLLSSVFSTPWTLETVRCSQAFINRKRPFYINIFLSRAFLLFTLLGQLNCYQSQLFDRARLYRHIRQHGLVWIGVYLYIIYQYDQFVPHTGIQQIGGVFWQQYIVLKLTICKSTAVQRVQNNCLVLYK